MLRKPLPLTIFFSPVYALDYGLAALPVKSCRMQFKAFLLSAMLMDEYFRAVSTFRRL